MALTYELQQHKLINCGMPLWSNTSKAHVWIKSSYDAQCIWWIKRILEIQEPRMISIIQTSYHRDRTDITNPSLFN